MTMIAWMKNWTVSPYRFYRAVYNSTPCGPSIGMTVSGDFDVTITEGPLAGEVTTERQTHTLYCDDLQKLGSFWDMRNAETEIISIHVSSIVEGVDQTTDTIEVTKDMSEDLFWAAVGEINRQADAIWLDTHGCERCAFLQGYVNNHGEQIEGADGCTPVVTSCEKCEGEGVAI